MTLLLAYHDNPATKRKYLRRVRAHRAADELVQGVGYEKRGDGTVRGCAIGCSLDAYDHSRFPVELGIPVEIAYLEDRLFERLPKKLALAWPERVLAAIPVGADLAGVWPRYLVWELRRGGNPGPHAEAVARLYERRANGDDPTAAEWEAVRRDALAARDALDALAALALDARAALDARDARDALAALAALAARAADPVYVAARAAAQLRRDAGGDYWACRDAARAARLACPQAQQDAAVRRIVRARGKFYHEAADKLVELLAAAPVPAKAQAAK